MGQDSKIEWTDHTFNPWWGCTHVHEGCRHCYAETWAKRFGVKWGPAGVRRVASEKQWAEPLKWNRLAEKAGVRAKVFCASMADVFEDSPIQLCHQSAPEIKMWKMNEPNGHDWQWGAGVVLDDPSSGVPLTLGHVRNRLFALIDQTPWLDWQLVTKRPENIIKMWPNYNGSDKLVHSGRLDFQPGVPSRLRVHRQNVWIGTSISDQSSHDQQIDFISAMGALSPVRFLSVEPLLAPISIDLWEIDWVIVGGESGQNARPVHPEWVRSIRNQCQAANVPFFFKQWGEFEYPPIVDQAHITGLLPNGEETAFSMPDDRDPAISQLFADGWREVPQLPDGAVGVVWAGKKNTGRLLDGRTWDEFPEVAHAYGD